MLVISGSDWISSHKIHLIRTNNIDASHFHCILTSGLQPVGMSTGCNRYFYARNAQNDIIALIDSNGSGTV